MQLNLESDDIENNMNLEILTRFQALLEEATLLKKNIYVGSSDYVKSYLSFNEGMDQQFQAWKCNVKSLLLLCFGDASIHYVNFLNAEVSKRDEDNPVIFNRLLLIFTTAYDDLKI